jgi:hypothetical protein
MNKRNEKRRRVRRTDHREFDPISTAIAVCARNSTKIKQLKPACKLLQILYTNNIFRSFIQDAVGQEENYFRDPFPSLRQLDVVTSIAIRAVGPLKPFSVDLRMRSRIVELLLKLDLTSSDDELLGDWPILMDEDSTLSIEGRRKDGCPMLGHEKAIVEVKIGDYGQCPTYSGYWFY